MFFYSVLTEKIEGLGEELKLHFNIEEISPVSLPAQVTLNLTTAHPHPLFSVHFLYLFY